MLLALASSGALVPHVQFDQRERHGDPRGLTASALAVFLKGKGVKLQSRKGFLQSHFLPGTPFLMSADGLKIIPPEDQ